jgi:hypothetical protein
MDQKFDILHLAHEMVVNEQFATVAEINDLVELGEQDSASKAAKEDQHGQEMDQQIHDHE